MGPPEFHMFGPEQETTNKQKKTQAKGHTRINPYKIPSDHLKKTKQNKKTCLNTIIPLYF